MKIQEIKSLNLASDEIVSLNEMLEALNNEKVYVEIRIITGAGNVVKRVRNIQNLRKLFKKEKEEWCAKYGIED